MSSYSYHSRRRPTRTHHRSQSQTRRIASPDEKKFLSGTAIDPNPHIVLEKGSNALSVRALDLISPIGMGQRALIISSPGLGKTTFLKDICNAVLKGYPEVKVNCVLIDERPEEVTDFVRSVDADVYASSMDQGYDHHIQVVDGILEKSFHEAAEGRHVMILLDSLTRLARIHNTQHFSGGRTLSGGVGAGALEVPRRIFGAARNVEGLGSITIIATILVDTGSRMDEIIYEEFKGTGNMELVLSKELASKRIFPAIDVLKSGTRRAEMFFEPEMYRRLELLRRGLAELQNPLAAMEKLIELLQGYPKNRDLLELFKDIKIG